MLLVIAITKFAKGAWVVIAVLPFIILLFVSIKRHYDRVRDVLAIPDEGMKVEAINHTVVVLVGRVHRGVVKALSYARSLRPQHLVAVYVSYDEDDCEALEKQWKDLKFDVPLEIISSPYRELVEPVERYLQRLDDRWDNDTITVVIPEFVVGKWYEQLLHNQSAFMLKAKLLFREGTVVTSVPYHVDKSLDQPHGADGAKSHR